MVFYHEATKESNTLAMSPEGTYFEIEIPDQITKKGGAYQLYFVLRENLGAQEGVGGAIGTEDDPVYQEVFISDVRKGIVDTDSGYSLIPNFD